MYVVVALLIPGYCSATVKMHFGRLIQCSSGGCTSIIATVDIIIVLGMPYCRSIGLLHIRNDCTFKMDPVVLTTVRPFVIDTVSLAKTGIHVQDEEAVADYLSEKVWHHYMYIVLINQC